MSVASSTKLSLQSIVLASAVKSLKFIWCPVTASLPGFYSCALLAFIYHVFMVWLVCLTYSCSHWMQYTPGTLRPKPFFTFLKKSQHSLCWDAYSFDVKSARILPYLLEVLCIKDFGAIMSLLLCKWVQSRVESIVDACCTIAVLSESPFEIQNFFI
jgi:hypothetical protein